MQAVHTNVFTREDTFFGVCQSIGDDFGFSPQWLRVGFALAIFWNPVAAIGAYLLLGAVVAFTRWMVPNPRVAAAPEATAEQPANAEADEELAVAA